MQEECFAHTHTKTLLERGRKLFEMLLFKNALFI